MPAIARKLESTPAADRAQHVRQHTGLVVQVAREYQRKFGRTDLEDLIQEGHIGLLMAIDRYDATFGASLCTYARYWVRATIVAYLLRVKGPVRVGSTTAGRKLTFGLGRARREVEAATNAQAEVADIARALGLKETHVARVLPFMGYGADGEGASLDAPAGPFGHSLESLADGHPAAEEVFGAVEEAILHKHAVKRAIRTLDARERAIIRRRYLGAKAETLGEIAADFDVSRERVRQIEAQAIGKLRRRVRTVISVIGRREP